MKSIKILFALFSLAVFTACENYSDITVEYAPTFPISGEWRVRVKETGVDTLLKTSAGAVAMYTFSTYNTSDNVSDKIWIRTTSAVVSGVGTVRGKIACDVPNLTFGGENVPDASVTTGATFSITEGKITLNALSMPSGAKADKISFKFTTTKAPGRSFLIEGSRRTLWPEDDTYSGF